VIQGSTSISRSSALAFIICAAGFALPASVGAAIAAVDAMQVREPASWRWSELAQEFVRSSFSE
jgi:hypothetical protein